MDTVNDLSCKDSFYTLLPLLQGLRSAIQLIHGSVVTCNHEQDYIVHCVCIFIKIAPIWENLQDIL